MANRNSTLRVALYARVSTKNNGQDPETQLIALREYASARKLAVFAEYVDVGISGSKDSRPALAYPALARIERPNVLWVRRACGLGF